MNTIIFFFWGRGGGEGWAELPSRVRLNAGDSTAEPGGGGGVGIGCMPPYMQKEML